MQPPAGVTGTEFTTLAVVRKTARLLHMPAGLPRNIRPLFEPAISSKAKRQLHGS